MRSLERDRDAQARLLRESLAGRADHDPAEAARRRHDHPLVLAQPQLRPKARAAFGFLAATHGQGRQMDLAVKLGVSPGRISQLEDELARVLTAHGYTPPLGRPPGS